MSPKRQDCMTNFPAPKKEKFALLASQTGASTLGIWLRMICLWVRSISETMTSVITASQGNSTCKVNHCPKRATGIVISCAAMFNWKIITCLTSFG